MSDLSLAGDLPRKGGKVFVLDHAHRPLNERATQFRKIADDARREAATASRAARVSYLLTAEHWERQAWDAELCADSGGK